MKFLSNFRNIAKYPYEMVIIKLVEICKIDQNILFYYILLYCQIYIKFPKIFLKFIQFIILQYINLSNFFIILPGQYISSNKQLPLIFSFHFNGTDISRGIICATVPRYKTNYKDVKRRTGVETRRSMNGNVERYANINIEIFYTMK